MALKKITAADFNAAIKKLTTSDASVWWKTLGTTEEGTELCFVMGWNDGYDEEDDLYQKDGYTLCSKIGYKPSNLMVMDYTDFNMPYDKKTADVWDTDMSVGKGEVTDDAFDVKWYNDEAEAIWKKYGNPDKEGKTALDLMESKKKESLADNVNLNFKVGDFKGTQKSVISKIKKALDTKGIANEVVADGRCLEVTLDNANVVIQTIAAGGYGSNKSASYVVLAKDSDDYRKQTDAYSIKDVMDYIEDAKGGKSESKKHTCSMQKKKESLAKKSEANLDDLKGMVVSEGTMGVNALIRKYLAVLETYAPDNYKAYIEANPELKDREVWMALDVEDKSYIVDELADELNKIAPEGYYFGASEGDGACYGFWEVNPSESKKQEADGEDSQATYAVCFDYVQTMCKSVKANSVEDAVEKARQMISKDMQVCEIWCNEKTLPNGTKVYLDGKDSDEKSYTEGGWGVV